MFRLIPSAAGSLASSILLAGFVLPPGAARANPSLVVDATTGQVIASEEATRPWIPASTTKLMTAYLALKALHDGRVKLETPLQVSALAAHQRPVKIYLKAGQVITLDNALKIMLVKSANDIAYVVAEGIGGSVDGFAAMMNAEAARLGMRDSHFVNPNGWDAPGHVSSARDLAILARAILTDFPDYADYFNIASVQLGNRLLKNTNGLVGRYPGILGMKTGFVCGSGFNVVAVAERGGRRLIAVVLGANSATERSVKAAQMLEDAFASGSAGGGSLTAMPASAETTAPNVCAQLRRHGAPLSDDAEIDAAAAAAVSLPPGVANIGSDNGSPAFAGLLPSTFPGALTSIRPSGRLSMRAMMAQKIEYAPLPVYLGPAPGSSEPVMVAGRPAAVPAAALAATPAARPAPTRPTPLDEPSSATAFAPAGERPKEQIGEPVKLPGVIATGAPGAIGAAASTRPKLGAVEPKARQQATPSEPASKTLRAAQPTAHASLDSAPARGRTAAKTPAGKGATSKAAATKAEPAKTAKLAPKAAKPESRADKAKGRPAAARSAETPADAE